MSIKSLGRVIEAREEQFLKAPSAISNTLSGILMEVRNEHPLKAPAPIIEILLGMWVFTQPAIRPSIDVRIIALQFYGPILLLFQQYDCEPEKKDEIKEMLFKHVRAFGEYYRNQKE